jgi:hypothetical protein
MRQKLDRLLMNQKKVCIISGEAAGADTLAREYAQQKGYQYEGFIPDWQSYGSMAGHIRNRKMCEYALSQGRCGMVAFWDGRSKGTRNSIKLAKELGIEHRVTLFAAEKND